MKPLNLTHLNGLRAVEAVARLGSLRAAAAELGVTVGAVSQQIARTEAALRQPLFLRSVEGMTPTAKGEDIVPLLRAGFAQIAAAVARIDPARENVLTVSVAPILASRWLVWALPDFTGSHPDIRLRIDASTALVDPNLSDVDLCIRVGRGDWPGVRAERLFTHRAGPVCHPDLARRITRPEDLAQVPIIREPHPMFSWDVWLGPLGLSSEILGAGPEFSDSSLCLDAAISGAGVFLAFEVVAAEALARGSLVTLPPGQVETGMAYWLVSAKDRAPTAAHTAFRRWLKARLARESFAR
ncbi:MAG TPA: LysR substrate-binding domain-containing protein [Paracoccaceae bacterium]